MTPLPTALRQPFRFVFLALYALLLIAGCTTLESSKAIIDPQMPTWQGRMALRVEDQPSQSFSARFELQGSPPAGELSLYSPLGSVLARLSWQADNARLHTPSGQQDFASLDDLMLQATGTALPVTALFDWLAGRATLVPGWQVDTSQQAQGRIVARRLAPSAELRVILDSP
jgi:outer membrane lipoprotein LolB